MLGKNVTACHNKSSAETDGCQRTAVMLFLLSRSHRQVDMRGLFMGPKSQLKRSEEFKNDRHFLYTIFYLDSETSHMQMLLAVCFF